MIGIVDYGLGNVRAFANIYGQLNIPFTIATKAADLDGVTRVILPGVGAFDQAMHRLVQSGMKEPLERMVLRDKVPVLGVCVGMQILMATSEEGTSAGLGWIEGNVVRFQRPPADSSICIPHMGWNNVRTIKEAALFRDLGEDAMFYFLHSYYIRCDRPQDILALTDYGGDFACAVQHGNVLGVQFHPEKSHGYGIQLLENFAGI